MGRSGDHRQRAVSGRTRRVCTERLRSARSRSSAARDDAPWYTDARRISVHTRVLDAEPGSSYRRSSSTVNPSLTGHAFPSGNASVRPQMQRLAQRRFIGRRMVDRRVHPHYRHVSRGMIAMAW